MYSCHSSFDNSLIPFLHGCFMSSLVDVGFIVLKKVVKGADDKIEFNAEELNCFRDPTQ